MADQIDVKVEDRAVPPKTTEPSRWGRRFLTLLVATAAVGGFAVVVGYSYDKGQLAGQETAVPIITAQKGPTKMRPKEPGGMVVPNRDKQIYGRLNIAERPDKIERLLPPPESVVSKPPAERDGISSPSGSDNAAKPTIEQIAKKLAAVEPAAGNRAASPPTSANQPNQAGVAAGTPRSTPKSVQIAKLTAPTKKVASRSATVFRIQLASVRSRRAAEKAWGRYQFNHSALFGKLEPNIIRVDLKGRGTFYRLQAGPFSDALAARSLCSEAKKRKIGCIIVRP